MGLFKKKEKERKDGGGSVITGVTLNRPFMFKKSKIWLEKSGPQFLHTT